jgi:hypothetical protein
MPSLNGLTHDVRQGNGKFLLGPLSQLGLVRKGTFFVIAAGRCNHAGKGLWRGVDTGNTSFIGIEAENSGHAGGPLARGAAGRLCPGRGGDPEACAPGCADVLWPPRMGHAARPQERSAFDRYGRISRRWWQS